MTTFELHPQLAQDSFLLMSLSLCQVRLMNNACYPWLILIPQRTNIVELFDLSNEDQQILQQETSTIAQFLKTHTTCDKINIATLGNVVPQLHLHIIARSKTDPDWPKPVWGGANQAYSEPERVIQEWQGFLLQIK